MASGNGSEHKLTCLLMKNHSGECITKDIRAAIRPNSMTVAPASSLMQRAKNVFDGHLLLPLDKKAQTGGRSTHAALVKRSCNRARCLRLNAIAKTFFVLSAGFAAS